MHTETLTVGLVRMALFLRRGSYYIFLFQLCKVVWGNYVPRFNIWASTWENLPTVCVNNKSAQSDQRFCCSLLGKYIEDIYSFSVNTINIVIECNENISIFTSAKHEWKFECFHYTRWKFLWYHWKRVNFLFILMFTRQCAFLTS